MIMVVVNHLSKHAPFIPLKVCLFTFNFCVCDAKNTVRCLVTHQTMFYIAGPIKKLSLKHSFCEAVSTCLFNRVL